MATFIEDIGPTCCTLFANMLMHAGDNGACTMFSGIYSDSTNRFTRNLHYDNFMTTMTPSPLLGRRTTNSIESDKNTILVNGIRDATPLEAILF